MCEIYTFYIDVYYMNGIYKLMWKNNNFQLTWDNAFVLVLEFVGFFEGVSDGVSLNLGGHLVDRWRGWRGGECWLGNGEGVRGVRFIWRK